MSPALVHLILLRTVRHAGSGTPAADAALDVAIGAPPRWRARLGRLQALLECDRLGWLLWGDGEPAALTESGLRLLG